MSTGETYPHVEPHLAVDPRDPQHFVAASMTFPVPGGGARVRSYVSFDGGRYWSAGVDESAGSYAGRIYVAASQADHLPDSETVFPLAVLRSSDGGRTFAGPIRILPGNINYQGGGMVVLPDGSVLATFHEIDLRHQFLLSPRLWAARSSDGGQSFSAPYLVTESFTSTSPAVAVGRGNGPHRGRVYAAWAGLSGDRENYLAYSDDRGATWSKPVAFTHAGQRRFPPAVSVAVSPDGIVGLAWPETDVSTEAGCFRMTFTASTDGGATFIPAIPATADASACADTPANRVPFLGGRNSTVGERWRAGGDYQGLVAVDAGQFRVLWADARLGAFQLWTAPVEVHR